MLQSILSNTPEVNSVSEPWILLPFLNIYDVSLVEARYNQRVTLNGFFDYIHKTHGDLGFKNKLKDFVLSLYQPLMTEGVRYIIDKTPRYYQILPVIKSFFPEAKIILLKRNPLAVINSMLETWGKSGTIADLAPYYEDIMSAPGLIQGFLDDNKDNEDQVMEVFYEDLVTESDDRVKKLYDWLGLVYSSEVLDYSRNKKYQGTMGDPTGVRLNKAPDSKGQDKWKARLENPYWNDFIRGYIQAVGENKLRQFGYDPGIPGESSEVFSEYQANYQTLYYQNLYKEIDSIKKSVVWRLARPIRWLGDLLIKK